MRYRGFIGRGLMIGLAAWAGMAAAAQAQAQADLTPQQKDVAQKAIGGDAQAQSDVGMMYYNGDGLPRSDAQALEWFRMSATQGNPAGEYNLGLMYLNGRGVAIDNTQAVKWLTQSALHGQSDAQLMLGLIDSAGVDGAVRDEATSVAWVKIAAQAGNPQAQAFLDLMTPSLNLNSDLQVSSDDLAKTLHEKVQQALAGDSGAATATPAPVK